MKNYLNYFTNRATIVLLFVGSIFSGQSLLAQGFRYTSTHNSRASVLTQGQPNGISGDQLSRLSASDIGLIVQENYERQPNHRSRIFYDLKRLSNPQLARSLVNGYYYPIGKSWPDEFIVSLVQQSPERVAQLALALRAETLNGAADSYAYQATLMLYPLMRIESERKPVDGIMQSVQVIYDEPLRSVIEIIKKSDPTFARALELRFAYRMKHTGRAQPLTINELPLSFRNELLAQAKNVTVIDERSILADPGSEQFSVEDGQIALLEIPPKGNIRMLLDRGDSVIVEFRKSEENQTMLVTLDSQMNYGDVLDQVFDQLKAIGPLNSSFEVRVIRGEYRHLDPLVAYILERSKSEGISNQSVLEFPQSLSSHDIRYFPRTRRFTYDPKASSADEGFELTASKSEHRLKVAYDSRSVSNNFVIRTTARLKRLDSNGDGLISPDELQIASIEELMQIYDTSIESEQVKARNLGLLKLEPTHLGSLLIHEFENEATREFLIRELFESAPYKLVRVIERMQEHPIDINNEVRTNEGYNAFRILEALSEEAQNKIIGELKSQDRFKLYALNIEQQLQSMGAFEAESSYPFEEIYNPTDLQISHLSQTPMSMYELRSGLIVVSNGNPNPSKLVVEFQPQLAMFAILIEGEGSQSNIFAVMDPGTLGSQFIREISMKMNKLGIDRTKARVTLIGDTKKYKGRMSSIARSFTDSKFGSFKMLHTDHEQDLSISLPSAKIETIDIDWESFRTSVGSAKHAYGLKVFNPEVQTEINLDDFKSRQPFVQIVREKLTSCLSVIIGLGKK